MLGSLIPSSRFLVNDVLNQVDWDKARVIVEYGPGVGTITQEILKRMRPDAVLLALELNVSERVLGRTRSVEHSETISHELAVIDQCVLDYHAGAARTGDDADLIDISQTLQSRTQFGCGIVVANVV